MTSIYFIVKNRWMEIEKYVYELDISRGCNNFVSMQSLFLTDSKYNVSLFKRSMGYCYL